jgi:hypothetical protein
MSRAFRAFGTLALLVLIALAIAAAVAITERNGVAERFLLERIAARGIDSAALRVTHVDARGIAVEDLTIGAPEAPDLAVAHIDATWSVDGVRAGRLDSLRIDGVLLRGARRGNALSFGALDALFGGEKTEPASAPVLPSSTIEIADGRIEITTPQGVAKGTLGGSLNSAADGAIDGDFKLALDGAGLRASGSAQLSGSLDEPAFRASLKPEAGLPIAGRVDARGRVTREKGERVLDVSVALRDASYTSELARASGINGAIALRAPPLRTPKQQVLSMARLDIGVPLTDGLVEFTLRRNGTVAVALASLHFASGELRAENVVLDLAAEQTAVTLQARSLDLTEVLSHVDLPGIEGTGFVEGQLPLVISKSAITVKDGLLRAAGGGGKIVYSPDEKTRALAASRPNDLGLAVDAFSDFQYEILEARLDGELQGEMKIGLHVRGVNPGFQDGRPVELNLNLEARLADLVRAGAASYRVPTVVEERLKAFSEGDKR